MRYLQLFEKFNSKSISKTLSFIKKEVGQKSADAFLQQLRILSNKNAQDYPIAIDKISDDDIQYMSALKAIYYTEPSENPIHSLKFWFSLENGYLGTSMTESRKVPKFPSNLRIKYKRKDGEENYGIVHEDQEGVAEGMVKIFTTKNPTGFAVPEESISTLNKEEIKDFTKIEKELKEVERQNKINQKIKEKNKEISDTLKSLYRIPKRRQVYYNIFKSMYYDDFYNFNVIIKREGKYHYGLLEYYDGDIFLYLNEKLASTDYTSRKPEYKYKLWAGDRWSTTGNVIDYINDESDSDIYINFSSNFLQEYSDRWGINTDEEFEKISLDKSYKNEIISNIINTTKKDIEKTIQSGEVLLNSNNYNDFRDTINPAKVTLDGSQHSGYFFINDRGQGYFISDYPQFDGTTPSRAKIDWRKYGEYSFYIVSHSEEVGPYSIKLYIDVDIEDFYNKNSLLRSEFMDINRYFNGTIPNELRSKKTDVKIKKADFALVIKFDRIKELETSSLLKQREESKTGATSFLSNEEIKKQNFDRYTDKLVNKIGINDKDLNNLKISNLIYRLIGGDYCLFFVYEQRFRSTQNLYQNLYKLFNEIESSDPDKEEINFRIKNIKGIIKDAYNIDGGGFDLGSLKEEESQITKKLKYSDSNEKESNLKLWMTLMETSRILGDKIKNSNINNLYDFQILISKLNTLYHLMRDTGLFNLEFSYFDDLIYYFLRYPENSNHVVSNIENDIYQNTQIIKRLERLQVTIKRMNFKEI